MLKEIRGGFGIVLAENGVMLVWVLAIENGACCYWFVQWNRGNKHLFNVKMELQSTKDKS